MARRLDRESLAGFAALGLTGLASALALLALASNRMTGIAPELVAAMLLAIQWHMVGLTLAKFGIDYALFAIVSKNRDTTYRSRDSLAFPVLPCVAVFALASLGLFSPPAAGLLALAVLADTISTFKLAEFNAKRAFYTASFGNLLNYPLFVALWAFVARDGTATLTQGIALFALTSLARLGWFAFRFARFARGARPVTLGVKGWIGAQGALNLALFRSDQILLALLLFLGAAWLQGAPELNQYVFLARLPELATGVLVLAGTVFFPAHHLYAHRDEGDRRNVRTYLALALATGVGGILAVLAARPAFAGPALPVAWCAPFVVQMPLILLANLATYSMQSQGHLPGLLRNLLFAAIAGGALATAAVHAESALLLAWVVPLQLAVFVALALAAPWGKPIALFRAGDVR